VKAQTEQRPAAKINANAPDHFVATAAPKATPAQNRYGEPKMESRRGHRLEPWTASIRSRSSTTNNMPAVMNVVRMLSPKYSLGSRLIGARVADRRELLQDCFTKRLSDHQHFAYGKATGVTGMVALFAPAPLLEPSVGQVLVRHEL
jgi:hypothetical protein